MNAAQKIQNGSGAAMVFFPAMVLGMILVAGCGPSAPPASPAPAKASAAAMSKTNSSAIQSNQLSEDFVSVFDTNLPTQGLGKDPFFPDSQRWKPKETNQNPNTPPPPVEASLRVKAITGSAGRRIAVINNETMMAGEHANVRQSGGPPIPLTLIEIGEDYVVIQIEGESSTKKLVMGQKK